MGQISHPNIIRTIDLIEDAESYYIISERLAGGPLGLRLATLTCLTETQAANVIHQLMLALNYIH